MNHRNWISAVDISRSYLHPNYHYDNWNMGAVRGACLMGGDSLLVYGNIGVWLTDPELQVFADFNSGFPRGIDNRKISKVIQLADGTLWAGTYFGLYRYSRQTAGWVYCELPVNEKRITDLMEKDGKLFVLTRSFLLEQAGNDRFLPVVLPAAIDDSGKVSLFRTLWLLHSGELWGFAGKLFADLFALVLVLLCLGGLLHFLFPGWMKRRRARMRPTATLGRAKRFNLKWHNRLGYVFGFFLVIITLTGMFLRPPLLIPIANIEVKAIPFTVLSSPNPWQGRLRRVMWDEDYRRFIFSTSGGMYFAEEGLDSPLRPFWVQPPVSVMGCNVLERSESGTYLVGSFNGFYQWNPASGELQNFLTGLPHVPLATTGPPIAADMIDGSILIPGIGSWYFDYRRGALSLNGSSDFPAMSEEIRRATPISPMSLWNFSQEVHTGRIFEPWLGMFYILYVPLAGLCILTVIVSGFFIWWLGYRKRKQPATD